MDKEFQGNEPQYETLDISTSSGYSKRMPGMRDRGERDWEMVGHHVSEAYGIKEPAVGTVIQFDSHKDDRTYAAIRTGDGWYVAGQRGKHTWSDLLADAKDPVFVMTSLAALHP